MGASVVEILAFEVDFRAGAIGTAKQQEIKVNYFYFL